MADSTGIFARKYVPEAWSRAYHKAREWARLRIAHGAYGTSKTHTDAAESLVISIVYGGAGVCLASSLGRCLEICYEPIESIVNPDRIVTNRSGGWLHYDVPGEATLILDRGRGVVPRYSRIRFKGANAGSVNAEQVKRGFNADWFWITEANVKLPRLLIRLVLTRLRASKFPRIMIDFNPDTPAHYLYKMFFPGTIEEIPKLNLDSPWQDGTVIDKKRGIYWQSLTIMHCTHTNPDERQKIIEGAGDPRDFYYQRYVLGRAVAAEGSLFGAPLQKYARATIWEDIDERPTGRVVAGEIEMAPVKRVGSSTVFIDE